MFIKEELKNVNDEISLNLLPTPVCEPQTQFQSSVDRGETGERERGICFDNSVQEETICLDLKIKQPSTGLFVKRGKHGSKKFVSDKREKPKGKVVQKKTETITIKPWDSKMEYMKNIKKAKNPYVQYLLEKKEQNNTPAFFLTFLIFF